MGRKHINAKEKLWNLQYDIKRMLEEGRPNKEITKFIRGKMTKLTDTNHIRIDW